MPDAIVHLIAQGDCVIGRVIEGQNRAGGLSNVVDAGHSKGQRRTAGRNRPAQVEQSRITSADRGKSVWDIESQITGKHGAIKSDVVPGEGVSTLVGALLVPVVVDIFQPDQAARERQGHVGDDRDLFQRSGRAGIDAIDVNLVLRDPQLKVIHVSRP